MALIIYAVPFFYMQTLLSQISSCDLPARSPCTPATLLCFFQMLTLENACFPMGCTSAPRLHGIKRQWAVQFYPITRTKHIIAWFAQAKHAGVGDIRCANIARL